LSDPSIADPAQYAADDITTANLPRESGSSTRLHAADDGGDDDSDGTEKSDRCNDDAMVRSSGL
jgi:hypothetical protein